MAVFFRRNTPLFIIILVLLFSAFAGQMFGQETRTGDAATPAAAAAVQAQPQKDVTTPAQPAIVPIHIIPYGVPAAPLKKQAKPGGRSSSNGIVQYWGGPVISNVQVVEVLWGSLVAGSELTDGIVNMDQFYTDVTQSNYFSLLAEYGTVGLLGFGTGTPGSNQTIGPGTFATRVTITPSVCPGTVACTVTDAQIQTEIINQLSVHHLPTPIQDIQGNFNTIYMVYFPPNVSIQLDPQTPSCRQGGFCAYHSNVLNGSLKVPYGVFPDFSQGGCAPFQGCGNGSAFQNLTSASSHELAEATTDVDVGSAITFAPPLGWADQNSGQEIGDFCNQFSAPITVNGHTYTVQTLLSNMQSQCVSAPGHLQVQSATNAAVPGVPFQVTVTAQSSTNSQLGGYNDTVHFTSSDGAAALPADYTFVPNSDNGSHTFTVTLNTTGSQTITGTDTLVTNMNGSATVDIEHNPDLTVTSSHSGSFRQGDVGDTYTVTASNIGDRATSGQVTVSDNVPFGLTLTAIGGTGWACNAPPTAICTRTDALAAGASYPPVTLTVSVATNAPQTVTNAAFVSGGGEANTSNDSFNDPTTIIQLPDLTIGKSHVGTFAQGQIGETYTLTVGNVGFAATSGTVTATDTLPTGLTATAISGTGWSCTLGTVTCTRTDPLLNGSSYPAITLTVNVAANAPMPSVTNAATVSGGGEINTANDTASDVTTITAAAADLTLVKSHSGSFLQGQTGATYTMVVSNIGPLATDGTVVTVSDSLPFGLTASAMSGTGWTCNAGTVSCTRSDALAAFTGGTPLQYPPITLTVNVSVTAPTPVTNSATVSGGGDLNTANNTAADLTNITPLPDLAIFKSHVGSIQQGETGLLYFLTINNVASGPTFGTVTVTDTLPSGLTATAISGSGWSCTLNNLTCTRSDVLAGNGQYPQIDITANVPLNAPSTVTNTATVSGGGEINTANDTATDQAPVLPAVAFSNFFNTAAVSAGGTAIYGFTVSSSTPGTVTLACTTGVPQGAACSFGPSSAGPGTTSINLSISTTFGGSAAPPAGGSGPRPLLPLAWLLAAIAAAEMLRRQMRHRTRLPVWRPAAGLAGIVALAFLIGCGGGGTPPPPPRPGTPAGTYTITVTGTNATSNTQGSTQVTLIVH
jgi:uncharacterized repeat protein (TIGR01451 family)